MRFQWPQGFVRIPDEEWASAPVDSFARGYDAVKTHGWYKNLEPTLDDVGRFMKDGEILLDYSGGTGIFTELLLQKPQPDNFGVVIVDSSPKFLRLAVEKFRNDERVGFRVLQFLKSESRLQMVNEVVDLKFDALVSTNAIHLYYTLDETLAAWFGVLKPGARLFIQSGNILLPPEIADGHRIIDDTVREIHEAALARVRRDDRFAAYRPAANDPKKMVAYDSLRLKYFLPPRSLEYYLFVMKRAGFVNLSVTHKPIAVRVDEWYDFLSVYHEGVLGWVGGAEKVEGKPPAPESVNDRLALMRDGLSDALGGKTEFLCYWTYITGDVPA